MNASEPKTWNGIREELLRRINSRVWAPGSLIPPETQLADEFQCSRATVNRAMRALSSAGLIERRRKAGTRVLPTPVRKAVFSIPITRLEIEGRGHAYRFVVLEFALEPATGPAASRLDVPLKSMVWRVRTLHLADNAPFLYEDRYVNPKMVPRNFRTAVADMSVNEWLVRNITYTAGDITFSAANASELEAEFLRLAKGTAVFIAERTTRSDLGVITAVRLTYPPGYRLHTDL